MINAICFASYSSVTRESFLIVIHPDGCRPIIFMQSINVVFTAEDRNPCSGERCINGGTCKASEKCIGDKAADVTDPKCHTCLCVAGYTGLVCETSVFYNMCCLC